MNLARRALCVIIAGALAGCAALESPCDAGQQAAVSDLLYFGSARPGGEVTAAEWDTFLHDVVTPRFPEGLTAWRASGQWRASEGRIVREPSWVLSIVHPASEAADASIGAVAAEYKARFRQQAVLRVRSRACISY